MPDHSLHMVFNPPYGERLDVDMKDFYENIGNTLKKNYPGTQAWFITSNLEALKYVGLKPSRKIKVFNSLCFQCMFKLGWGEKIIFYSIAWSKHFDIFKS